MVTVILVRAQNSGNIGAVARAMANFDYDKLLLINPKASHLSEEAFKRAKHGKKILKKAKVVKAKALNKFSVLVGTTGKVGTDYNIRRTPLSPRIVVNRLRGKKNIALLVGGEDSGLTSEELGECNMVVSIPASKKYPVLNISHALTIIVYEFSQVKNLKSQYKTYKPISKKELDVLQSRISDVLNSMKFTTKNKRETQKTVFKRVFGKAMLTKREAFALMGFFKKLKK
ncbi:TrmJ/YjtD family RNA methyltransferase [Candidatus Woesearchaeota archaeon]|nr:TrmJ/YjtD family RNA methyltransferase [Candidatus Woesearchaeota archaeon]